MPCATGMDYCIKAWYEDGVAFRSCGVLATGFPDDDCTSMDYEGKSADVCTCKTDLCNGAYDIAPFKALSLIAVAIVALLFK